jgi:hypothetical protein
MENRIKFMMDQYNIDRKKARIVVDKRNKQRINLYRYFGRDDYEQPKLYHMVFNMNFLRLENAVQAVCQLLVDHAGS